MAGVLICVVCRDRVYPASTQAARCADGWASARRAATHRATGRLGRCDGPHSTPHTAPTGPATGTAADQARTLDRLRFCGTEIRCRLAAHPDGRQVEAHPFRRVAARTEQPTVVQRVRSASGNRRHVIQLN